MAVSDKKDRLLKDSQKEKTKDDEPDDDEAEQEPEWEEPLLPWTAVVVLVYLVFLLIALAVGFLAADISPRFDKPNPDELWHSKVAVLLIVSGFLTEMCFLASSATNAYFMGWTISSQLQMNRLGDSMLTLMEYGTKFLTGLIIWLGDGGVIHADTLAIGGSRPVYLARFLQWALGVPTLILITNRSFIKKSSGYTMIARSAPGAVASFFFCWSAWLHEVTTSHWVRWMLLSMCLIGHIVMSMDQIKLAHTHRHEPLFGWKIGMLTYQIVTFSMYAILFCSGRFNLISSLTEQTIYAYADATIKVFQGAILAMIRNREDLVAIRHWWTTALSVSQDLETLITKARVPVFALSPNGKIIEWNSTLEELTGRYLEDLKGVRLSDVVDDESAELLETVCNNVIKAAQEEAQGLARSISESCTVASSSWQGNFVEMCIPAVDSNFQKRQLAMTLVPRAGTDGELAGIVGIGQDLSEMAQLKIVQERKSALMAMLSHEIRSPLHGMMGLTGAMLETDEAKGLKRQLGMVKGCAARLLDLVTNIMDLAQHEKRKRDGKPTPRPAQPVNFAMIADEVVMMTNMAVDKTNKPLLRPSVRLVNKLSTTRVPLIKGDPQKCTQLVYNLVTNACKFTEAGTVTLQARHMEKSHTLEVDVVDTGKGISKEGQKRIFQAFEQEQNGDTRSFQGIGLGLAVCTEIAELHGGELRVRSELGRGSTFTASFPCSMELGFGTCEPLSVPAAKQAPEPEKTKPEVAKPEMANKADRSASETPTPKAAAGEVPLVLSVDDDFVNQEVVRAALNGMCEIYCAMSGNEAIKYLESRKAANKKMPDTVLLDIQMPGMDGFEVCEEIRKRFEAAHSKMPIIMISAKAPADQATLQCYGAGTTDFVPKPFNPQVLRSKVDVVLKAKREFDLGGATTTVAREAHMRVKETQSRLKEEQVKAKVIQDLLQDSENKAKDLQSKFEQEVAKNADFSKREEELNKKIADLERQHMVMKKDAQESKTSHAAEQADAGAAAATAAAKAAEAERERAKAAEARREQAERKAQDMSSMVERLTEKLKKQESMMQTASMKEASVTPLPIAAFRELHSKAASAQNMDDAGAAQQTTGEVGERDMKLVVEQQRQIIGAMLLQMSGARAVIRALSSRIEILNALSRGCADMLHMHPGSSPSMLMLESDTFADDAQQEQSQAVQFDWLKTVTRILSSQLAMMEHMSMPPQDLTAIAQHVDSAVAQLSDGQDDDVLDKEILFMGA